MIDSLSSEKLVMTAVGPIACVPVDPNTDFFKCKVCGVQCAIAPSDGSGAVCPEHCQDHHYQYQRGDGHRCVTCFATPPEDYFYE